MIWLTVTDGLGEVLLPGICQVPVCKMCRLHRFKEMPIIFNAVGIKDNVMFGDVIGLLDWRTPALGVDWRNLCRCGVEECHLSVTSSPVPH